MKWKIINLFILLSVFSCNKNSSKGIELQEFSKIKVENFKKKKVEISSSLRFLNSTNLNIKVVYAEFDILINGIDVATFISKESKEITSNGIYELPIKIEFSPQSAFPNLDYGLVKIKSDIVADVEISGFITTLQNEKTENIKYTTQQKVLFSNNKNIYLDENNVLKEQ